MPVGGLCGYYSIFSFTTYRIPTQIGRYTAAATLVVQLMRTVRISSFKKSIRLPTYLVVAVSLAAGELHMLELLSRFVTTVVQEEYLPHMQVKRRQSSLRSQNTTSFKRDFSNFALYRTIPINFTIHITISNIGNTTVQYYSMHAASILIHFEFIKS